MSDTVQYSLLERNRRTGQLIRDQIVSGAQVGRFAIRHAPLHERWVLPDGRRGIKTRPYVVDHMPSGVSIGDFRSWSDAAIVADDLSRFCAQDPDSALLDVMIEQIGAELLAWVRHCVNAGAVPFRQWRELGTAIVETPEGTFVAVDPARRPGR